MTAQNLQTILLNTGSLMPLIGYGTYKIKDYDLMYKVLDTAFAVGYRSIDTASVYRNEEHIGKALKELLPKHGLKREDIFITSKLAPKEQGFDGSYEACLRSLNKLDAEYLDLYLVHWPGGQGLKPEDPRHPALRKQSWLALQKLCKEGKVRNIGVSNYTMKHMTALLSDEDLSLKPAVLQIEHHPYLIQSELLSLCRKHAIHFQAYSSLGTTSEANKLLVDPVVCSLAEKHQKGPAQVLLKWATQQKIGVLPKSTNMNHIRANYNIGDFTLSDDEMNEINSLDRNEHFCWNPQAIT